MVDTDMNSVTIFRAATAGPLAAKLVERLALPVADPFVKQVVVVPGAGMRRWLSQQLALSSSGICAGVEFYSFAQFEERAFGPGGNAQQLLLAIQQVLPETDGVEQLRTHLASSREPYTALSRIARRFLRYAEYRPEMVEAWAQGLDVGPNGAELGPQSWQSKLWRAAIGSIPSNAPAREPFGARWSLFCPPRWSAKDSTALSGQHVDIYLVQATPSLVAVPGPRMRPAATHRLNHTLAGESAEIAGALAQLGEVVQVEDAPLPNTLLGWLQADLRADAAGPPRILDPADSSIRIHLSHGLDRQVEVLRDAIADAFQADPTLEPRDVLVVTPDQEAAAPLLAAGFGLGEAGLAGHPAHQFRLQVADRAAKSTNPLIGLLFRLLRLPDTRMTAAEILDLCAEPPIARRFGFGADKLPRLAELVEAAEIRWGLNTAHRANFGLDVAQNTWVFGLQRLLLSVALGEQDLCYLRNVSPIDDVESSDVVLLGGISELIGRIGRLMDSLQGPAGVEAWAQRCRDGLDWLVEADTNGLQQVYAGLARLVNDAAGSQVELNRPGFIRALEAEFSHLGARAAFGNGSLIAGGPSTLRWVPHRLICLLGWDAVRYPRRPRSSGDDLMAAQPRTSDPDPGFTDRQLLADAIQAAGQRLIIVAQGRHEVTNLPVSLAAPIAELLESLDRTARTPTGVPAGQAVTEQHSLQPFSPQSYHGSGLISFDKVHYAGALATERPKTEPPDPYQGALPPRAAGQPITLEELLNFFAHPARALIRAQAGFGLGEREGVDEEIPIDPNGLEKWQLGERYLRLLRTGHPVDRINAALWRSGVVPPGQLGATLLTSVSRDAAALATLSPTQAEPQAHDIEISTASLTLSGRVTTFDNYLLTSTFSRRNPRYLLVSWIRGLALAAAEGGDWQAVTITRASNQESAAATRSVLAAPDPEAALHLLEQLATIYRYGCSHPIPALPRLNAEWAHLRNIQQNPLSQDKILADRWDKDADENWRAFFAYPGVLDLPVPGDFPLPAGSEPSFVGALAQLIWQPLLAAEVSR
jgi:exodeoxyribonuclease V gamma subunit